MRRRKLRKKSSRVIFLISTFFLYVIGIVCLIQYKFSPNDKVAAISQNKNGISQSNMGQATTSQNVIVIDPGHGGRDNGANYGGIYEKNINLSISLKVRDLLTKEGYAVMMSRTDDTGSSIHARVPEIIGLNPSCVISIHSNYVSQTIVHGIETYCNYNDPVSNDLASRIQSSIIASTGAIDRKVQEMDYYLLRNMTVPTALVEVGFLSNSMERSNLSQEDYQNKLARGIANGIMNFMPKSK